ncbi:Glycosyl hydrolase family protein [Euphorbia peplus]|nr:Glycosyl hydrolase family protein [Euphorbia peplus]
MEFQILQITIFYLGQLGENGASMGMLHPTAMQSPSSTILKDTLRCQKMQQQMTYVLKAGMDVNCGNYLKNYTKSAVQKKKVSVADIDRALHKLFSIRMRLGLFDSNSLF